MAGYADLELVVDSTELSNVALQYLVDVLPGWTARPSNVITVLLEASGQMSAEVLDQASPVPPGVYATICEEIYGITRQDAVSAVATATVTWDPATAAIMLDAGSQLIVPNPSGEAQVFLTDADLVAPAGGGTQTVGVTAQEPGAQANGSTGIAELVTDIDSVETITVSVAQGGQDAEDDDAYLDRATDLLSLLAPRPILPDDHAVMALHVPGVERATAIDLLQPPASENPVGDTGAPEFDPAGRVNVPRCTTVAIAATGGAAPDVALMQSVYQLLDSQREVNFLNYIIAPTYTTIDVRATVVVYPGQLPADVVAAAEIAVRNWLDPSLWGTVPGAGRQRGWALDDHARVYEAVQETANAMGVMYVQLMELRAAGGTYATADVPLPGTAPLPLAGEVLITAIPVP